MGRVEGKVALITGAARGQGRSHAVRLAEEGASVIAIDACAPIDGLQYEAPSPDDLTETASLVEATDGRIVTRVADVRNKAALEEAVAAGVAELGPIDVICTNAAVFIQAPVEEVTATMWDDVVGINLTGTVNTVQAALPSMREAGDGGSIILISSSNGLKGFPTTTAYGAAKHGVVGLMRVWANELGAERIRVNTIHPSAVPTPMLLNDDVFKRFRPDLENPTKADAEPSYETLHLLPIPWLDEVDISNAVLWLASDEARYVTGQTLSVDAGFNVKV